METMKIGPKGETIKLNHIPFNISFLLPHRSVVSQTLPVRTIQNMDNQVNDFHPQGLYSTQIFGAVGSKERDTRFSYIDLKTPIFHPLYFQELSQLKALYGDIILGKQFAKWDEQTKDFIAVKGGPIEGETGFSFFMRHWKELEFKPGKSQKRMLRIALLEHYRDKAMMDFFVVIPAGLRDIDFDDSGRPVEEEINDLYKSVISAANAINPDLQELHPTILDQPKRALQKAVVDVDKYIFEMLRGKRGFLAGKFGSRKVFNTTRNVLSSMEVDSDLLGEERMPDLNTTVVGIFQFMKAAEPLLLQHTLPNSFLGDFIENVYDNVDVVDTKTLKSVNITPSAKTKDKWGTEKGRESLLDGFKFTENRHNPIKIDGHYLKLVYRDDKVFRLMNSIDELPEGWKKENVKPLTWGEMFYIITYPIIEKTRCFNTRYPVTGLWSIFPNKVHVKTTTRGFKLKQLDADWNEIDEYALEYPDVDQKLGWHSTMSVHPAYLSGLGADQFLSYLKSRSARRVTCDKATS